MPYLVLYQGVPIGTLTDAAGDQSGAEFELDPAASWVRELVGNASEAARNLGYLGSVDEVGDALGAAVIEQHKQFTAALSVVGPTGLPRPDLTIHLDAHPLLPGRIFAAILPKVEPDANLA